MPVTPCCAQGIGFKLLKKMGFKGRCGKFEQGTAKPIATQVRGTGGNRAMGLNYNGFRESVNLKANREFERDFYDHKEEEDEGKEGEGDAAAQERREEKKFMAQSWRRGDKKSKVKRKFRTAAQLLNGSGKARAKQPTVQVIDMRGPQARKLTSLDGIQTDADPTRVKLGLDVVQKVELGAELLWNMRQLVGDVEQKLHAANHKLRAAENQRVTVGHERERLKARRVGQRGELTALPSHRRLVTVICRVAIVVS